MLSTLADYAANWPYALLRLGVVAAFVYLQWFTINRITPFSDTEEIFDKNNYAYLVQRLALLAAQAIAMLPSLARPADSVVATLTVMCLEGLYVFVALLIVRPVVDFVLLRRVNNLSALLQGNLAVGITEAGFYLGFGALLNGSLTGGAPSFGQALASTLVFAVLGLALVIAVFFLHELVTPYDLRQGIADGRVTPALEVAGILVAVAIVVRVGVAGEFTGWGHDLGAFLATSLIAVVTLYLLRWAVDLVFLTGRTVGSIQRSDQAAAAALLAGLLVLLAFPVATVVANQL